MAQKFYVDVNGVYLGSFDGVDGPEGSVEIATAPDHALQIWDKKSKKWGAAPAPEPSRDDKLFAALKSAAPSVFTDVKIAEIKG